MIIRKNTVMIKNGGLLSTASHENEVQNAFFVET